MTHLLAIISAGLYISAWDGIVVHHAYGRAILIALVSLAVWLIMLSNTFGIGRKLRQ